MFDIHKVKPVHGWREFIGEVGIIVLGVLIALGAEQVVESVHQHYQLAETREFLDDSLADAKAQSLIRVVIYHCVAESLDRLQTEVENGHTSVG